MKKKRLNRGFTLIELIVVLAILSILAVMAVPRYLNNLENARISAHNANVRAMMSTAMLYQAENGELLADLNDLTPEYLDTIPNIPEGLSDYITEEQYANGYSIEVGETYFTVTPETINP